MFIDDYIERTTFQEEPKNVKEQLKAVQDENAELKTTIATLTAAIYKLSEEKQQEGDNLRNRIKDLESEIDQLKSNPTTVSYSELLAIHTADVETINKLNIKARDLNGTISTLLERVSKSGEEVQYLKREKDFLTKQVEHLQSCLDLEKNKD